MRLRPTISILALAAATLVAGCAGDPDQTFCRSADRFVNRSVGPEYEAYFEHDPALTEDQKQDRRANVAEFRRAVEAKKKELGVSDAPPAALVPPPIHH